MKKSNTIMQALKKALVLVMALVIAVSFSQPLNAQAKAKVKTVKLKKQVLTVDRDVITSVASHLAKGKNKVVVSRVQNSYYEGYAKFTAPKAKTYKITFNNVKPSKGSAKLILGAVHGYKIKGQTIFPLNSFGPRNFAGIVQLANKNITSYKKSYTATVKLEEGETVYMGFQFKNDSRNKTIQMDVNVK